MCFDIVGWATYSVEQIRPRNDLYCVGVDVKNEFDFGGIVAFVLQDHRAMLPRSVSRLFRNVHNSTPPSK